MAEHPVFFDPKGRRARLPTLVVGFLASVALAVAAILLVAGIVLTPQLPSLKVQHGRTTYRDPLTVDRKGVTILAPKMRGMLAADLRRRPKTVAKRPQERIVLGYYAPWESAGLDSLKGHAASLTHVAPQWLHLSADGGSIDYQSYDPEANPKNLDVDDVARRNGLRVVPILDNSSLQRFDRRISARLLGDPALQSQMARQLAAFLLAHDYDGIHLDFEELNGEDSKGLVRFAKALRETFAPLRLSVSAAVEAGNDELDLAALAEQCDWIVPMLYDEHSDDGAPGPVASLDWCQKGLERVLETVPESKVVMGVGNFGYDWVAGEPKADSLTFQEAMTTAEGYRSEPPEQVLGFDEASSNTTFAYRDDEDRLHRVWLLDAVSAYNQCQVASDMGIRGAALWNLGSEDPALWSFFDRRRLFRKVDPQALAKVSFSYEVSFSGRGEILNVESQPVEGRREVTMDDEGFVSDCRTLAYAEPFVVAKSGYVPKKIALTFDDGPDRQWTPLILNALRRLKVPATFFDIGVNVESMPDLVAREYDEGHEVANHSFTHPDLGLVGDRRARLEINLTQMAIEGATGHSTSLFRPPYNADSEPETPEQLRPIIVADKLGYITVGENVDPTDWDLQVPLEGGGSRPKTADDIADAVVTDLKRRAGTDDEGNIVLLHDAGGDRSQTVEALEKLVPRLRAAGYEFVTVSRLIGKTRDGVMPPISAADRIYYTLGRWGLGTAFKILGVIAGAFTVAIVLGVARTALVVPLALVGSHRRRPAGAASASVSVVIAAYNEAAVIVRTVESVLASDVPLVEVVVVDDGSTDATADVAREAFRHDPRVVVLSKPNGGKASALNEGIARTRGELLFHIDADTLLHPAAIGRLAAHFHRPDVAAVAGNVQVGNRLNLLTSWQDLEYITSQNLDRRAYALLNCVTVVPGAIGMWRRKAVLEAGGYQTDTLAEDMDLTWTLRRAGHRLENEPEAYAYTEAPERFRPFFGQRFRWAYGTLQCLFKHRGALGRYGWFGRLALPTQWLFGVAFQALAPLVDLQILVSLVMFLLTLAAPASENRAEAISHWQGDFYRFLAMYGLFLGAELIGAGVALRLEKKPLARLAPLLVQRFVYRQLMYGVMYKSLIRAVAGGAAGWGKLSRTGSAKAPAA